MGRARRSLGIAASRRRCCAARGQKQECKEETRTKSDPGCARILPAIVGVVYAQGTMTRDKLQLVPAKTSCRNESTVGASWSRTQIRGKDTIATVSHRAVSKTRLHVPQDIRTSAASAVGKYILQLWRDERACYGDSTAASREGRTAQRAHGRLSVLSAEVDAVRRVKQMIGGHRKAGKASSLSATAEAGQPGMLG